MAVAGVEFSAIEEADPQLLSLEEFLEVLNHAKFLEEYIHSIRAHALKMVERDPLSLPGWKLGWSKRMREWDDEAQVLEYCTGRGLKPDEFSPRSLLTPAQMTKLIKRRFPLPRRKKGDPEHTNPLDAFVRYTIPSAKLVPDDAADDFTEIEGDE